MKITRELERAIDNDLKQWMIDNYSAIDAEKGSVVIAIGGVKAEGTDLDIYCTSITSAVAMFKKDVAEFIGVNNITVKMWPKVKKIEFASAEVWQSCSNSGGSYSKLKINDMYQIITFINVVDK